jgi:hypothetical protein
MPRSCPGETLARGIDQEAIMNVRRGFAALGAAAALGAVAPATANAEETTCRGTLGAVTVDNLRVPQNARCIVNATTVQGTVKVERGATLGARGVRVIGNVQAENARQVNLTQRSRVGGSVQVKQGGGARVLDSRVNADIQYDSNSAALEASRNAVGGSIQVFQNRGGARIASNRIDGNLQCKENRPAPTGGGNVVQGNKEDQCSRL